MVNLVYRCLTAAHAGVAPEPQVWDAGVSLFRAHYRETNGTQARVFPGVMETLRALSWAGLPMACVTNKPAEFSGRLLEKMGLADFFQTLISGDSLPLKKPDPLPLLTACAQLAVPPSQTLMVGDSEPDIAAARAAGCPVFCVSFGYNEGKPVEAASCDLLLDDFSQVLAHIDAPGLCALSGAA
jgi:phosphoglycolate phosphatase